MPVPVQLWFLADGRMHSIRLNVPRTFYIDSTVPLDEVGAHRSPCVLISNGLDVPW